MQTPREKILERANPNAARANRWVWVCTIIITAAIVGVWGYGFVAQVSFFSWSNSNEAKLIKNTREQWNFFFANPPTTTAGLREEVTTALTHIVASSTPPTVVESPLETTVTTTTTTSTP